ncbi:MAG: tellurite resistance TerB family protein [Hyphomicrobiaceae bacterium]
MLPGGGQGGQPHAQQQAPGGAQGGGLGDILGKIQEQLGRPGQGGPQGAPGGGLMDILGQILGQAGQGVKEGAQRIDQSTGASGHARDALGRATGQSPEELLQQLKDLIAQNKLGAGVAAGGLGTVLLGTKTGRAITGKAVKIGGLALIAGLAYKALQNYQAGRPLITGGPEANITEAPRGSGFETAAITNAAATTYLRGMIAAAAADGRIDAKEHQQLLGGMRQAGIDAEAEEFLAAELNNPATVDALVAGVTTQEEAVQLFTAARIAIDLDTQEEHDFLVALAQGLQLPGDLIQHIDATARAAT